MYDYEDDRPLGGCMVLAFLIGTIGTILAFAILIGFTFVIAIDTFNLIFDGDDEVNEDAEAVEIEIHDKPLFTLEQQRELVQDHRTAVVIGGENVVFEWGGEFPEELKPFMWGYPE